MTNKVKMGVQQRLTLVVFLSVILASLAIFTTLFLLTQKRSYRDTVKFSEEMIQAASMAFSQAISVDDEILLDALIHELISRKELHIIEAFILASDGLVVAHSNLEEYGKIYPVPKLLREQQPSKLSEVLEEEAGSFRVISLLQTRGQPTGTLVVSFSTEHLTQKVKSEMLWIVGVTVPILILSGLGVMTYGRYIVSRLRRLQKKARAIGQGEWGEPITVVGTDEISQLTDAFNQMQSDLYQLRAKEHQSAETIQTLNRDLSVQLKKVEQLKEQLAEENLTLREELRSMHNPDEIIGSKGSLRHIIDQVRQLASLPITVLITGESGTGKELLTRFLHESGARKDNPFITVNCAALPVTLIESELFGHEKGAFTGALNQKKGKFEVANGGTLFLDEIGELPLEAQAKLLRALQEGEIYRLGGNTPISVDVRVVAVTNRDLEEEVEKGNFREDLYYRLKVVELVCPPLRERIKDLPALAQHMIEKSSRKLGKPVLGIAPSTLQLLSSYHWPGNIRELENMIERAVALAETSVLGPEDFVLFEQRPENKMLRKEEAGYASTFDSFLNLCGISNQDFKQNGWDKLQKSFECICLKTVLEKSKNQKEAAKVLGMTETKLHRLIKKHSLKK